MPKKTRRSAGKASSSFPIHGRVRDDEDVCRWLQEVDKDHDGRFDFSEFCRLYSTKREPEDKRREELLLCVNTVFPSNGSNDMLDLRKVKATMKRVTMGLQRENTLNLSSQEIDDVLERFDKHKGNQISRREFVDFLINTSNGE
ncbi:hypothetical protein C0Q70_07990 [Pomacea canaliculata]|uniref:EF-hand domain-containing protein n=2 Tax=Pomacea canaliculata TaxID=400727 RepID=A0A2T7PGJ7_POMCA|nr:hypothetical protein C0Q70_07990 [Pomacea canaliculata]